MSHLIILLDKGHSVCMPLALEALGMGGMKMQSSKREAGFSYSSDVTEWVPIPASLLLSTLCGEVGGDKYHSVLGCGLRNGFAGYPYM